MIVWSAWLQGRDTAPAMSRRIFDLWAEMNPGWDLRVIEDAQADDILRRMEVPRRRLSPQVVSDLCRLSVLAEHGGVWADATLLPVRPLDDWLAAARGPGGFFAFRSPGADVLLSSWFLSAEAGHPLVIGWRDTLAAYFRAPRFRPSWKRALWTGHVLDYMRFRAAYRRKDYGWFMAPDGGWRSLFYPYAAVHYAFAATIAHDPALQALWDGVPCRSAVLPHVVQRAAGSAPPAVFLSCLDELLDAAPVHKLNNRDAILARAVERAAERAAERGAGRPRRA